MSRPKLFVLEPSINFEREAAAEYGETVYIFCNEEDRRRPSIFAPHFPDAVVNNLDKLGFDPSRDILLLSGSVVAISRALCAVGAAWGQDGQLQGLAFDSVQKQFVVLPLVETVGEAYHASAE